MRHFWIPVTALIMALTPAIAATPHGVWLSSDGRVKVKVSDCQGALCGRVVWLKEPLDPETRRPRTDKQNPDASKRDRPMLGLNVVRGLQPAGENKWSGAIYNADDGKSYDVNVKLVSSKKMALEGCVLGVLCKSQMWTRAE
jgi:uncharacterized protein (DUF2147 family)